MDNKEDIDDFLNGYKTIGNYDNEKLKWCIINAYCHFYLMNKDIKYRESLLNTLKILFNK